MNMNTILDNTVIFEKLECKIVKIPQLSGLYFFLKKLFIYSEDTMIIFFISFNLKKNNY